MPPRSRRPTSRAVDTATRTVSTPDLRPTPDLMLWLEITELRSVQVGLGA